MTAPYKLPSAPYAEDIRPQGHVLKGQYMGAFRSSKGKLKGLLLRSGTGEHKVKLPKYLRPMLVRELAPESFIQIWAYPDEDIWRAINILPLPEAEISRLQQEINLETPSKPQAQPQSSKSAGVCIQVCRKGKCFKQGSKQIWSLLQAEVEANPALQHVSIEATGCMKACKKGPNLRILPSGRMVNHVHPTNALAFLSQWQ
ncbi:MAG: (2Fe-2S) ferredoxin domain-containing protein [Leptolyngbya sp. SIO1D8]|nr:(2Fe-2S) ferredoxin domain-containing protein [Leptolyngbya sp. SIO1D8]